MIALLIILAVLALLTAPSWGYSRGWGYGWYPPGGFIGLIVLIIILEYFHVIPRF